MFILRMQMILVTSIIVCVCVCVCVCRVHLHTDWLILSMRIRSCWITGMMMKATIVSGAQVTCDITHAHLCGECD